MAKLVLQNGLSRTDFLTSPQQTQGKIGTTAFRKIRGQQQTERKCQQQAETRGNSRQKLGATSDRKRHLKTKISTTTAATTIQATSAGNTTNSLISNNILVNIGYNSKEINRRNGKIATQLRNSSSIISNHCINSCSGNNCWQQQQ